MVTAVCYIPTCMQIPKVFAVCVISNAFIEHSHLSLVVEISNLETDFMPIVV